jgi:hypothetical protein
VNIGENYYCCKLSHGNFVGFSLRRKAIEPIKLWVIEFRADATLLFNYLVIMLFR